MLWVLHLLQIITYTAGVRASPEEILNNNGWTPISRERVFDGINREFIPHNNYAEFFNQNLNDIADNENIYNHEDDLLKLFKPWYVGHKRNWNSKRSFFENISSDEDYYKEKNSDAEVATSSKNAGQRKAKVVSTNNIINDINNLDAANILKETLKVSRAEDKAHIPINQYEVTESNEVQLASKENKIIDTENSSLGYSETNNVLKVNADDGNDFTNRFLEILSNYNIRVNDALPNYDQSKSSKRSPPKPEYVLIPVPIRFLGRYKLADDPLLGLILSNYGYNPGGGERVRSGHRASYGRPASYDIYNNQYPGLYKAYSDTDSSQ